VTRAQRRIAAALASGAHIQLTGRSATLESCDDPYAVWVLVHTCDPSVDPDGFRFTEIVQERTLMSLHRAGLTPPDADRALGFDPHDRWDGLPPSIYDPDGGELPWNTSSDS